MSSIIDRVQFPLPRDLPAKGKPYILPVSEIRPTIRIAHRLDDSLRIPDRMIVDHEIVLFLRGEGEFSTPGKNVHFCENHLFVIPPFLAHGFASASCEHIAVHFDLSPSCPPRAGSIARRRPYEVRLSHEMFLPLHQVLKRADGLTRRLIGVVDRWREATPLAPPLANAELVGILAQLLRRREPDASGRGGEDARNRARIERAIQLIHHRYASPLTHDDIRSASRLGSSQFLVHFRGLTGCAPMEYLQRVRVQQARELLVDVDLSIKEIAARTGFSDPYHFSRVFRRIDGLSPAHYRETVLSGKSSIDS